MNSPDSPNFDLPARIAAKTTRDRRDFLKAMLGTGAAGAAVSATGQSAVGNLAIPSPIIGDKKRSLKAAIYSTLKADRELMSQLPGGIWQDFAPRGATRTSVPYGLFFLRTITEEDGMRTRTILKFATYAERDKGENFPWRSVESAESLLRGRSIRYSGGIVRFGEFLERGFTSNCGYGGKQIDGETIEWELEFPS